MTIVSKFRLLRFVLQEPGFAGLAAPTAPSQQPTPTLKIRLNPQNPSSQSSPGPILNLDPVPTSVSPDPVSHQQQQQHLQQSQLPGVEQEAGQGSPPQVDLGLVPQPPQQLPANSQQQLQQQLPAQELKQKKKKRKTEGQLPQQQGSIQGESLLQQVPQVKKQKQGQVKAEQPAESEGQKIKVKLGGQALKVHAETNR